jgi:hypothetical protein
VPHPTRSLLDLQSAPGASRGARSCCDPDGERNPEGGPPGRSRASPSTSRHGRSTQQASTPVEPGYVLCLVRRSETMFSMPLAYSSTLDQRLPVAHTRDGRRPTWRSLGARTSRALEKRRQKHTLNASVYCKNAAPGVFLSQAGPRFDLDLFKLSITFVLALTETLRTRKRRPGWVALIWLAMRLTI